MKEIKCKKCGSKDFWLEESLGWKCFVDDDGELQCHNKANEIEKIVCEKCDTEIEKFNNINFN